MEFPILFLGLYFVLININNKHSINYPCPKLMQKYKEINIFTKKLENSREDVACSQPR